MVVVDGDWGVVGVVVVVLSTLLAQSSFADVLRYASLLVVGVGLLLLVVWGVVLLWLVLEFVL